jgi:predicted nucleic acid-binding protein
VRALLDTNILIAASSTAESTPDLSEWDQVVVSTLTWSELTMGLHSTGDLAVYKERVARLDALRALLGKGIAYDDECVRAYDHVLRRVTDRGGSAKSHRLDRMIAATALAHGLVLVTRNIADFAALEGLVAIEQR